MKKVGSQKYKNYYLKSRVIEAFNLKMKEITKGNNIQNHSLNDFYIPLSFIVK